MLPWAWHVVKGEVVSINETDYQQGREKGDEGVVVWRMCCLAHTGNEVSCGVGGVA